MSDILMYIIGVLIGIFILLSVLSYKNYISKNVYLFNMNFFGNAKNIENIDNIDNIENMENMENMENIKNMENKNNNIIEGFDEENNSMNYDDTDLYNTIVCNKNIIDNFKINRLLKKNI